MKLRENVSFLKIEWNITFAIRVRQSLKIEVYQWFIFVLVLKFGFGKITPIKFGAINIEK